VYRGQNTPETGIHRNRWKSRTATEAAVRDFQRFLWIPVSGVFDAVTRMVLTTAVIRIQTGVG